MKTLAVVIGNDKYYGDDGDESDLVNTIANEFAVLPQKIHIHSTEKLQHIELRPRKRESSPAFEM